MKIAIIHDSFLHMGGAEKVFYKFVEKYPDADIFIPLINRKYASETSKKTSGKLYISWLNKILFFNETLSIKHFSNYAFTTNLASLLKPLLIIYWETLNLKKYDLVISSSHSFSSKSVNRNTNAKHVSYIHTPPKYLYAEYNRMNWIKKFPFNVLLWPVMFLLRKYDYYSGQKPDFLVANSKVVQKRIKKYYKRNSVVINPLFDANSKNLDKRKSNYNKKAGKYFLFFSRLEKQKGAELVVKTCTKHNIPLVVMGTGSQEKYLKKIAGKTVFFTGFVSEEQKIKIFEHTKALIYASIDEDFGMVVPEVSFYGIPVINLKC